MIFSNSSDFSKDVGTFLSGRANAGSSGEAHEKMQLAMVNAIASKVGSLRTLASGLI